MCFRSYGRLYDAISLRICRASKVNGHGQARVRNDGKAKPMLAETDFDWRLANCDS